MLQAGKVFVEEKRFLAVRAQCLVHAVAEEESMIENGNTSLVGGRDRAVDVYASWHCFVISTRASSARSDIRRCFSAFAVRRGTSIGGSRPKLIFIGAKSLHGVE